jgi:UDP-N-acetylglucosamine 2-epimerase (non-hydrolysing)/GDP/UDP-N,N'-diacetylbacillosamine 2-epimerase (hydrolysing)
VVDIGQRQKGREKMGNVINVGYDRTQIKTAIKKAVYDKKFKEKVKKYKNPYGNGGTARRIADVLSKIKINEKLLNKK